jgi:hypothetical protein
MLQLNYGDKIRFTCSFQHKGAAYTGAKLHAAIGNKKDILGVVGWFDEVVNNETTITGIVADSNWVNYTVTVDITITTALGPGAYESYVKLMSIPGSDIFWVGSLDEIVIAGGGGAEFQNISVSYGKV